MAAELEGGLEGDLLGDGEGLYDDTFVENSEEQPTADAQVGAQFGTFLK